MLRVGCRYSAVSPIYMSNDRLEPFNYNNIAFKRCADVVSLERLDRLWFFRHHWFVKIGWFGKCWTDLLAFWGVWNWSRILNFGPDRLFFRFSRALVYTIYFSSTSPFYCLWMYAKLLGEYVANSVELDQTQHCCIWPVSSLFALTCLSKYLEYVR